MQRVSLSSVFVLGGCILSACSGSPNENAGEPTDGGSGGRSPVSPAAGGTFGSGGAQGSGGTTGSEKGGSSVSFEDGRFRLSIVAANVKPGDEDHVCVVLALPNTEREWIDRIDATLVGGSHHLIVDRSHVGSSLQAIPESCPPTQASDETRLAIAQQKETEVTLPEGTAFALEPRQPIFLQLHYFNSTADVIDIAGMVDLVLAEKTATPPVEAKSIFTGSFSIDLPPNSPGSSESFVLPVAPTGTRHVFALTSHTHQLGVRATIERVASASAPPAEPIHESLNWDEPPLTMFSPPLVFDGSDGLRLICNYENHTDQTVRFGTGVDQEMCFMWVYYFDR